MKSLSEKEGAMALLSKVKKAQDVQMQKQRDLIESLESGLNERRATVRVSTPEVAEPISSEGKPIRRRHRLKRAEPRQPDWRDELRI
jgi:hypothetical protein